jgi:Fibrobacter succinogenes major domain (Fib_succ_major).
MDNLTTGAWVHYDNDSQYENPYGKLYNWYTVDDPRNVCPTGWHVPTDAEYTLLTDYLGGGSVAGGKMKSTGTQYWLSPNSGATNESGFSGLPGGYRLYYGTFGTIGESGYWWSSTEVDTSNAWYRNLDYYYGYVYRVNYLKKNGFSVRCLRD